ncbi:hypothetical protein BDZ89DRAFT_1115885 [Hymenopellis radicata]|nr:hypothetical protein BDZ89DRAFT_1115885 [Hymenopellis radicata]
MILAVLMISHHRPRSSMFVILDVRGPGPRCSRSSTPVFVQILDWCASSSSIVCIPSSSIVRVLVLDSVHPLVLDICVLDLDLDSARPDPRCFLLSLMGAGLVVVRFGALALSLSVGVLGRVEGSGALALVVLVLGIEIFREYNEEKPSYAPSKAMCEQRQREIPTTPLLKICRRGCTQSGTGGRRAQGSAELASDCAHSSSREVVWWW